MRTGVLRRTEQGKAHTLSPCSAPEPGSPKRRRRSRTGKRNGETKSPRRLDSLSGGGGFLFHSIGVGNIWRQRLPQSMEKPLLTLIFSVTARVPVLAEWEGFELEKGCFMGGIRFPGLLGPKAFMEYSGNGETKTERSKGKTKGKTFTPNPIAGELLAGMGAVRSTERISRRVGPQGGASAFLIMSDKLLVH